MSVWISVLGSFGYMPRSGIAGSYGSSMCNILGSAIFHSSCTIYIPPEVHKGPNPSAYSPVLGALVKAQVTTGVWVYFWTLNSMSLIYVSTLVPAPCVDLFVVSFEIRKCESFCFLKNTVLCILGSLQFHMIFRINFSISVKKLAGVLMGLPWISRATWEI